MILKQIIEIYLDSREFDRLAETTKRTYRDYLTKEVKRRFGNYSALKLANNNFTDELEGFLEDMKDTPRKAKYILQIFKSFATWAKRKRYLDNQAIKDAQFAYRKKDVDDFWDEKIYAEFFEKAPYYLRDYMTWASETGLRRGDLIKLKWTDILYHNDIAYISVVQSKTKKKLHIPLSRFLLNYMKRMHKRSEYILTSSNHEPWSENKFKCCWGRFKQKFPEYIVKPHGLRKLNVSRLAIAGATVPEIASILGWSITSVNKMLDEHYLNKKSVAFQAISRIDNLRDQMSGAML